MLLAKKEENSCNSLVIILSIKQISTYKIRSTVSAIKNRHLVYRMYVSFCYF